MRITEGRELSGAAIQVDKTWTKCRQESKTVVHCNHTKWLSGFKSNQDTMRNDEKEVWHKRQNIREFSRVKNTHHRNKVEEKV